MQGSDKIKQNNAVIDQKHNIGFAAVWLRHVGVKRGHIVIYAMRAARYPERMNY